MTKLTNKLQFNTDTELEYYRWLTNSICPDSYARRMLMYSDLLWYLYISPYTWEFMMDENRFCDGQELVLNFAGDNGLDYYQTKADLVRHCECSMLEMMGALAIRLETSIKSDIRYGDRTGYWFWGMIENMGLSHYTDKNFDATEVDDILRRFLARDYAADGRGGLFYVEQPDCPMYDTDIWHQAMWFLHEESAREEKYGDAYLRHIGRR